MTLAGSVAVLTAALVAIYSGGQSEALAAAARAGQPSPSASATVTPSASVSPSTTPSASTTPDSSPDSTPSAGPTNPTGTPTATPTPTPSPTKTPVPVPDAVAFSGTSAVGTLFATSRKGMTHFCSGAVVQSKLGNLVITAAHCLEGRHIGPHGNVVFVPGYHSGHFPHGAWIVASAMTDRSWQRHQNPNDDVAFLTVGRSGHKIQNYTGAESLRTNVKMPQLVRVIGYPDSLKNPIRCDGPATIPNLRGYRQIVFDCGGYTNGTSGAPFLMHISAKTGEGTVIGVIGGYELGGDLASVSYSARFLSNITALYEHARRY